MLAGKALYVEGNNFAHDHQESDFFTLLGCDYLSDGFMFDNIAALAGSMNSIVNDMQFQFTTAAEPQFSLDALKVTQGSNLFCSEDSSVRAVSFQHPGPGYRVITSSFIFGALLDGDVTNQKAELMRRYMDFLINGSSRISSRAADAIPSTPVIFPNYPNPFNSSTTIEFQISHHAELEVRIYNSIGQQVKRLHCGVAEAGLHRVTWDGTNDDMVQAESGVYLFVINSGEQHQALKLVLVK